MLFVFEWGRVAREMTPQNKNDTFPMALEKQEGEWLAGCADTAYSLHATRLSCCEEFSQIAEAYMV